MSSQFAMSVLSSAEFLLWVGLGLLFWKKGLGTRFPAMAGYLALHVVSTPFLLLLLYLQSRPSGHSYFPVYFFAYWLVYIGSAVLLFFICTEVFRSALSAFPGLMKIGIVIFRWAILVSLIVTFSSISYGHRGLLIIPSIADGLMRSVSVLELCLLAFLCLSMNALRLSTRDLAFGIALGFGLMSANDFIFSSIISTHTSLTAPMQIAYESLVLVSILVWGAYSALPQLNRKPVLMPVSSTIYRWNEIASALGHTGTQVAVQEPVNSFFLTDVEKVVEKVLSRNLKGRESEM
jgi:hypothetical protein